MLNLSEDLLQQIRSFADQHHLSIREITCILKGEQKLLPQRILNVLPKWYRLLAAENFNDIFTMCNRMLSQDSSFYIAEGKKLIFFLSKDVAATVPLMKTQLEKIKKHRGSTLFELLFNMIPEKYETRVMVTSVSGLQPGEIVTCVGTVKSWKKGFGKKPAQMQLNFCKSNIRISFFGRVGAIYEAQFPAGSEVIISGEVSKKSLFPSFTNPDIFKYDAVWKELLSGYVPIYKKIPGVSHLFLLRCMREIILKVMKIHGDWMPPVIRNLYSFPDLITAIINIHFPSMDLPIEALSTKKTTYHKRVAFDKVFFFQYAVFRYKLKDRIVKNREIKTPSKIAQDIEKSLPFPLTNAQVRVLREIRNDLSSKEPMSRLLQGDVGSGKTVVMMLAALDVVARGYKSVIMAPTEILARQHYDTIHNFTDKSFSVVLVTGGMNSKKKKAQRKQLIEKADIIIGTHALYENLDTMEKLGLVVIDEQHRFGVSQRMKLMEKATHPDVLVVSATPIPRSLALTMYGGVDISVLNEMPPGRTPVRTKFVPHQNREKVINYVQEIIQKEQKKGYWVCPLVEESEKLDLYDVTKVYEDFNAVLGNSVRLLHGKMKADEKKEIIDDLRHSRAHLLVSTIVVEVGVDIPDASFMVIENADRFGLAQLHQLRGRVGRGKIKSFAALIASEEISGKAADRLQFMSKTVDGFKIAEFDLKTRGPGALTGYEQSGFKNDPYYMLAAQYGVEVQKAQASAKKVWHNNILNKEEMAFIDYIFEHFFKERFERYKVG